MAARFALAIFLRAARASQLSCPVWRLPQPAIFQAPNWWRRLWARLQNKRILQLSSSIRYPMLTHAWWLLFGLQSQLCGKRGALAELRHGLLHLHGHR